VRSTNHEAPYYTISTSSINLSHLDPSIFLSTLFSNTLSLCSSLIPYTLQIYIF